MKLTEIAHFFWKKYIKKGDFCIDATCGNGQDSLFLAKEILTPSTGSLLAIDIQKQAVEKTKRLLQTSIPECFSRIEIMQMSHESFATEKKPKLVCYNLGFLPGSDKTIRTKKESTLQSLDQALSTVQDGGIISILSYVGHQEGQKEYEAIHRFQKQLDSSRFETFEIKKTSATLCPILILIEKKRARRPNQIKASTDQKRLTRLHSA